MKILKCPSCGAQLKNTKGVCEYCGNAYLEEENKKDDKVVIPKSDDTIVEPEKVNNNKPEYEQTVNAITEVIENYLGMFIFGIVMLTFCFPVGVIILISLISKVKKEN